MVVGEVFEKYVKKLIEDINVVKMELYQLVVNQYGVVCVGMLLFIGNVLLMFLIVMVNEFYFQLKLEISIGLFYVVKEWLKIN